MHCAVTFIAISIKYKILKLRMWNTTDGAIAGLVRHLRRYRPPAYVTLLGLLDLRSVRLCRSWYSRWSTLTVLWHLRCSVDVDPVVPSWTDSASLLPWDSIEVDGSDLWRTTRLSFRSVTGLSSIVYWKCCSFTDCFSCTPPSCLMLSPVLV